MLKNINKQFKPILHKKIDFDKILGEITETNNKISLLSDFMTNIVQTNNKD